MYKKYNTPRYWYLPSSPNDLSIARNKLINILSELQEQRDINNLPVLYWALIDKELGLQVEISNAIHNIFTKYTVSKYAYLDSLCRERTSLDWSFDWQNINLDDVLPTSLNDEQLTNVLGFLSFHPNGYLREMAINSLAKNYNSSEIPFLLIRINDWVPQIRIASLNAFDKILSSSDAKYLAAAIPLIKRLENCSRISHTDFVNRVLIKLAGDKSAILFGLKCTDNETRRYCFKIAIDSKQFSNNELLAIIQKDKNGHVRSYGLKQLEELLSKDEIRTVIPQFFNDKFARVRIAALDLYCKYFLDNAGELLKVQLLSDFRSARETAQFYLKKLGFRVIHDFYIEALPSCSVGAILGLSEIGQKNDYKLILPFLTNARIKIVRASIRAISKLGGADATDELLKYLEDSRNGVSKEVTKHILAGNSCNLKEIENIYLKSDFQHVKENSLRILCSGSPWDSLPFIIESYSSINMGLKNVGTEALKKWLERITHVYTKPTDKQKINIFKAIENNREKLDSNLIEKIEFNVNA